MSLPAFLKSKTFLVFVFVGTLALGTLSVVGAYLLKKGAGRQERTKAQVSLTCSLFTLDPTSRPRQWPDTINLSFFTQDCEAGKTYNIAYAIERDQDGQPGGDKDYYYTEGGTHFHSVTCSSSREIENHFTVQKGNITPYETNPNAPPIASSCGTPPCTYKFFTVIGPADCRSVTCASLPPTCAANFTITTDQPPAATCPSFTLSPETNPQVWPNSINVTTDLNLDCQAGETIYLHYRVKDLASNKEYLTEPTGYYHSKTCGAGGHVTETFDIKKENLKDYDTESPAVPTCTSFPCRYDIYLKWTTTPTDANSWKVHDTCKKVFQITSGAQAETCATYTLTPESNPRVWPGLIRVTPNLNLHCSAGTTYYLHYRIKDIATGKEYWAEPTGYYHSKACGSDGNITETYEIKKENMKNYETERPEIPTCSSFPCNYDIYLKWTTTPTNPDSWKVHDTCKKVFQITSGAQTDTCSTFTVVPESNPLVWPDIIRVTPNLNLSCTTGLTYYLHYRVKDLVSNKEYLTEPTGYYHSLPCGATGSISETFDIKKENLKDYDTESPAVPTCTSFPCRYDIYLKWTTTPTDANSWKVHDTCKKVFQLLGGAATPPTCKGLTLNKTQAKDTEEVTANLTLNSGSSGFKEGQVLLHAATAEELRQNNQHYIGPLTFFNGKTGEQTTTFSFVPRTFNVGSGANIVWLTIENTSGQACTDRPAEYPVGRPNWPLCGCGAKTLTVTVCPTCQGIQMTPAGGTVSAGSPITFVATFKRGSEPSPTVSFKITKPGGAQETITCPRAQPECTLTSSGEQIVATLKYIPATAGQYLAKASASCGGTEAGVHLKLEAEAGTEQSGMQELTESAASACKYVNVLQPTPPATEPTGNTSLTVSIPKEGDYYLWGRTKSASWSQNSFFVKEGNTEIPWEFAPTDAWQWGSVCSQAQNFCHDPYLWHFSQGNHTLIIRGREALAKLDALEITDQSPATYQPSWATACSTGGQ